MKNHQADAIEDRRIGLGAEIIALTEELPPTPAGRHLAGQILRSGTSPAANYSEARGAESRADFVHKLDIALKELNETNVWLRMMTRAQLVPESRVRLSVDECLQLARVLNASVQTARRNAKC